MPPPPPVMRTTLSENMLTRIDAYAPNASAATIYHAPRWTTSSSATWRAFLNAHARVTRAIGRDLAEAGLPDLSWYDLLWTLYRQPGRSLRVKELADEVVLSPTAMSRFVDRVEAAGYVRREPDPDDRRALQVTLTDEGVELLRRMWPVYARRHRAPLRRPPRRRDLQESLDADQPRLTRSIASSSRSAVSACAVMPSRPIIVSAASRALTIAASVASIAA